MKKIFNIYNNVFNTISTWTQPFVLLGIRLYVSSIFFKAGLRKIQNLDNTIYLFENEFQVPILSPQIAAYMATAGELVLPVFLTLGLLGRLSALKLFVLNAVAVISYPKLLESGFYDHKFWGLGLLIIILWGPGAIAVDYLICKRLKK